MRSIINILILLLISCSNSDKVLEPLTKDEIDGEVLFRRITTDDNYKKFRYMPGNEGLNPGQSPHGVYHRIYANNTLLDTLPNSSKEAPNGSIIVKENYNLNKELEKITVMAKVSNYNPRANNWFWAIYKSDGEVISEGKLTGCISCHSGMRDNDFIIVKELDR